MTFRKLLILAFAVVSTTSVFAQSTIQKKGLKTETDTLSYVYGAGLVEQGLMQYLQQMGVLQDTATISNSHKAKIEAETDAAKKATLKQEYKKELDAANLSNKKNVANLLRGAEKGFNPAPLDKGYAEGVGVGMQFLQMISSIEGMLGDKKIDKTIFLQGVKNALGDGTLLVEDASTRMTKMQEDLMSQKKSAEDASLKLEYADRIAESEAYMAQNKLQDGIVALPSGLQYKVNVEGQGEKPTETDQVKVHYTGKLVDGTVFDSSVERGEPIVFGITQVIKGWTEALMLMPVGSKWTLYLPYDLAYGSSGAGVAIPPFSNLVFEVELISIEK